MKKEYAEIHGVDPSPLLEYTDNMTEELSELGSDDEEKNCSHKAELVRRAGLTAHEIESGVLVWEIVRPGHCSEDVRTYSTTEIIHKLTRVIGCGSPG